MISQIFDRALFLEGKVARKQLSDKLLATFRRGDTIMCGNVQVEICAALDGFACRKLGRNMLDVSLIPPSFPCPTPFILAPAISVVHLFSFTR
jgi:hypothetical protein